MTEIYNMTENNNSSVKKIGLIFQGHMFIGITNFKNSMSLIDFKHS